MVFSWGQIRTRDDTKACHPEWHKNPNHRLHQECNFSSSHCFLAGRGRSSHSVASLSFIVIMPPSQTSVLHSREVSAGHRMDVKALALICAQVQALQRFNEADFYLMWTDSFSVSHRPQTLCLRLHHLVTAQNDEPRKPKCIKNGFAQNTED